MPSSVRSDGGSSAKSGGSSRRSTSGLSSSRQDLICSVKYTNNLPDIPFDPKFLVYPFEQNRFIQYNTTSLESNHKHELMTEVDLGVPINLIDPKIYTPSDIPYQLDPKDEELLEEDTPAPTESKRAKQHAKTISWLRKTEYISSEYARTTHMGGESSENKIGIGSRLRHKQPIHMDLYKDKDTQISAIETTFEEAKEEIKSHSSKPGLEPEWVLPLFPDQENWHLTCAHIIFDSDPSPHGKGKEEGLADMSSAIMRAMTDERDNEEYIAYFLPSQETLRKRMDDEAESRNYVPGEEYAYELQREYNWNLFNKTKGCEDCYLFMMKGDCVSYNDLSTRIKLNKRRGRGKPAVFSTLAVTHREMTEEELNGQDLRMMMLDIALDEGDMEELGRQVHVQPEYKLTKKEEASLFGDSSDNLVSFSDDDML